ncbi:IS3 family transposase [bacterium]|nr:IS3 family transposase [bacterium]MCI0616221.1 IS3 family transposase [bacterium]
MIIKFLIRLGVSIRRACFFFGMSRSSFKYQPRRKENRRLLQRLQDLAIQYRRFGYRRMWALLRREGWRVNHKQVYRLWKQLKLSLPRRRAKKKIRTGNSVPCCAERINHVWTYDFMHDRCTDGRKLKILTIVDEFSRRCLAIEVGTSITATKVIVVLQRLFSMHGVPQFMRSDNGPEFIAKALKRWLSESGSQTYYINPGSPWENAYGESFNGKLRDECLNAELFFSRTEAKEKIEAYRSFFNSQRPHSSLQYLTPDEFAALCQNTESEKSRAAALSLSLLGIPDAQQKLKRRNLPLRPSVYSPATALESLSSVALSSGQTNESLSNMKNCTIKKLNQKSGD